MTFSRVWAAFAFVCLLFAAAPSLAAPDPTLSAAPVTPVEINSVGDNGGPQVGGISMIQLFWHADLTVKIVFVVLVLASLWSWIVIINKWLLLGTLSRRADKFEKSFWSGLSLDELYQQFAQRSDNPMTAVFTSALREWRRAFDAGAPRESMLSGVKERIEKAMNVTILRETIGIEKQLGLLATVGAVAPFIGLFGTVWGIINAFSAIGTHHDVSLATVAPGMSEALFATAMGLLAAIPAVIFYNKFVNDVSRYSARLESFADEFSAILSRQLDEKAR
ncbi:MAG TPA: protein TolQ [Rhizomicrobium sp.]